MNYDTVAVAESPDVSGLDNGLGHLRGGFRVGAPSTLALLRMAAITLALAGLSIAAPAAAQTMGEYGGATAHSAAAASSMPKIEPPPIGGQPNSSAGSNPSGPSHTEEIRTYEVPSTARSSDDKDTDKDQPHGSWEQVK